MYLLLARKLLIIFQLYSLISSSVLSRLFNAIQAKGAQRDSKQDAELLIVRAAKFPAAEAAAAPAARAFVAATNMEYDRVG